jgi:hypothetical protein
MNRPPLNPERVAELLKALRQRNEREIITGTLTFAGSFTPEMWRALELLAAERSALGERKISRRRLGGLPP